MPFFDKEAIEMFKTRANYERKSFEAQLKMILLLMKNTLQTLKSEY